MTRFSNALLMARFCAMTAIAMLFVVALLLVELVSAVILGFKLILSPAARAKFKGELLYPGARAGVASGDPAVVRLRNVAIAAGAFTITLIS